MILDLVFWYAAMLLAGALAFPLSRRLLAFLPDRGYTLAKPLGLLLWGYAYWLLAAFNITQNDIGGVLFGLLVVAALSAAAAWRAGWDDLWDWFRANLRLVLVTEALFLLAFAFWALVRGTYPDVSGTEKPMELAFINAILHSPTFPPHDPWLSGYAISYYYFGYIIVAMLARFTGIPGEVAFNLGLCSWFALSAAGAYGVLFNLLAGKRPLAEFKARASALYGALLAPLFLLLASNFEGLLEVLHARGLFWQGQGAGASSPFWSWLGIQELVSPPGADLSWTPQRAGGIWWWRASRVLQDFDFKGQPREIIDEFPFFSYLLGDLHPHVLAMPFVLLAVGLALNLYFRVRTENEEFSLPRFFKRADTWLAAVVLGGLAFLNTWDFPIYLALFGAAYLLARYHAGSWQWGRVFDTVLLLIALGAAGIALYLPFYIGFQSQAGGLLPSLVFFSRGTHFWIIFGVLLIPTGFWLASLVARRVVRRMDWTWGIITAAGVVGGLWALSFVLGAMVQGRAGSIYNVEPGDPLLVEALLRRLQSPGAWLTLLVLLAVVWALLAASRPRVTADSAPAPDRADPFVLLLVLVGVGLALFPEFFYLRDQFGWRMNTIFKFYYQGWVMWSLAAAYGSVSLFSRRGALRAVFTPVFALVLAAALVYPVFGLQDRTNGLKLEAWSLNGAASLKNYSPDDWAAIEWIRSAEPGVVAEAVGGSYSGYARVSTFSGQPSVLGWPGHESQWRGGYKEMGSREPDIEKMFRANRWEIAQPVIAKYDIRYVYVGPMERTRYRVNENIFKRNMTVVYQNEQVTIYETTGYSGGEKAGRP